MSEDEGAPAPEVGYQRSPASTRFRKGQSGNPKGRPRGRRKELPYEAVLGQMVTIREDGVERQVTAAEAFLLQMTKRGLEGDGRDARAAMVAIEEARAKRGAGALDPVHLVLYFGSQSLTSELVELRMGRKLDQFRPTARIALEPWLVQQALARLGDRRLSREEQAKVMAATRTPKKVKWPEWWEVWE